MKRVSVFLVILAAWAVIVCKMDKISTAQTSPPCYAAEQYDYSCARVTSDHQTICEYYTDSYTFYGVGRYVGQLQTVLCESDSMCSTDVIMRSACDCDHDNDNHLAAGCGGDDCDDNDASVHPGIVETACNDNKDNDCDGFTDYDDTDCDSCGGTCPPPRICYNGWCISPGSIHSQVRTPTACNANSGCAAKRRQAAAIFFSPSKRSTDSAAFLNAAITCGT